MTVKVLYVDDDDDIREIAVMSLELEPEFAVRACSSGEEAIGVLGEWNPDVVLLDVMMPGKSGLEVLDEIRNGSNKKLRDIPVMMITAKSGTEDIDKALELGANSYIVKPFRGTTIREKVRGIFELPFNG